MEIRNHPASPTAVHRAVALGLALVTTSFIATSVVTVFTGSTQLVAGTVVRAAVTPLRAMLGG